MIAQKLRGLVGQGMSGGRKSVTPAVYNYPAGSYTFTVPKNGWYRFIPRRRKELKAVQLIIDYMTSKPEFQRAVDERVREGLFYGRTE